MCFIIKNILCCYYCSCKRMHSLIQKWLSGQSNKDDSVHCIIHKENSRNSRSFKNTKSKGLERKNGFIKQLSFKLPLTSYIFLCSFIQQLNQSSQSCGEQLALSAHIITFSSHFSCMQVIDTNHAQSAIMTQNFPHFDIFFGGRAVGGSGVSKEENSLLKI